MNGWYFECNYNKNICSESSTCWPANNCKDDNNVIDWRQGECTAEGPTSFDWHCYDDNFLGSTNPWNDANDENVEWYWYLVGAILVLFMFMTGIYGGYLVYKKRCCRKEKKLQIEINASASGPKTELLEA